MSDITEMGGDFDPSLKSAVYPASEPVAAPAQPAFKPFKGTPLSDVVIQPKPAAKAEPTPEAERLANVEKMISQLLADTSKTVRIAMPTKELDYSKLDESAVYDLSIPIIAIEHGLPESMKVELQDPNYVARWVHVHPQRLGGMKAVGFTTVTREDLAVDLNLSIEPDENGAYRYVDTILMKISKAKYFGQLRRNHQNAVNAVRPDNAHAAGKQAIENYLQTEGGADAARYMNDQKLSVYTPGGTI